MSLVARGHTQGDLVRTGRWTEQEHHNFLRAMIVHGRSWTKVAQVRKLSLSLRLLFPRVPSPS